MTVKTVTITAILIGPEAAIDKIMAEPIPLIPGRYEIKSPTGELVMLRVTNSILKEKG